jgi:hypothetical protein
MLICGGEFFSHSFLTNLRKFKTLEEGDDSVASLGISIPLEF